MLVTVFRVGTKTSSIMQRLLLLSLLMLDPTLILLIPMRVIPLGAIRMTTTKWILTKEANFISIPWITTKTLIVHEHFTVNVGLLGTKLD